MLPLPALLRSPTARRRLVCGVALAVAPLAHGPAAAQSAASRIDQPTAATLPAGTSTVGGDGSAAGQPTGRVSPPSAIQSSTDVMQPAGGGSGSAGTTDPMKHLPKDMR